MRSSPLDFRECLVANSQTVAKPLLQAGSIRPFNRECGQPPKGRDGLLSVGLATFDAPIGPQFLSPWVLRFSDQSEAG